MISKIIILAVIIVAISAAVAGTLFNQKSCDAQSCPQEVASSEELDNIKKDLDSGAILLDVRTPEEYSQGHATGAVNIPYDQISNGQYPTEDKNSKIYLYCRSGNRASQAEKALEEAGYTNIENIQSLSYWQSIGGNIE